jgi:HNH endonuclease
LVAQPVEWVLVIYYGPSAHRATYGRLDGQDTKYTKDYIQLSKKTEFLDAVAHLFPVAVSGVGSVRLTYQWPTGTTAGTLVFNSADRPHLKWETSLGAPKAWKMSLAPSEATAETLPGDPSHLDFAAAEKELALLASRGAGRPYLMAIKLRDEPRTLHLRAYLKNPSSGYAWADLGLVPQEIQALAAKTSQQSALAWSIFQSGGTVASSKIENALSQLMESKDRTAAIDALDFDTGRALIHYLRRPGHGLFFDPTQNHDAWSKPMPLPTQVAAFVDDILQTLEARFPAVPQGDAAAEALEADHDEVAAFCEQIEKKSYEVADSTATIKTRGSAQKAFAEAVKANYEYRCAITAVVTKDFLIAAHIVPWSEDQTIRLDPSNGICLSLLVDRAFEKGYLQIEDDLTIRIDWGRVGDDQVLRNQLEPYDGQKLSAPAKEAPQPEYLRRRRALVAPTE